MVGLIGFRTPTYWPDTRRSTNECVSVNYWFYKKWSGRKDLNLRPPGPEPGTNNPINAFSGVACGTTGVISPLLLVPNLYLAQQGCGFSVRVKHDGWRDDLPDRACRALTKLT